MPNVYNIHNIVSVPRVIFLCVLAVGAVVVVFVIHKVLRLREIKSKNAQKTSTNLSFYVSHHLLLSFIIVINIKK